MFIQDYEDHEDHEDHDNHEDLEDHDNERDEAEQQESNFDNEEVASDEKSFPPAEEDSNVSAIETNGIDNEDSINLDIGEDEENLLGEEVHIVFY